MTTEPNGDGPLLSLSELLKQYPVVPLPPCPGICGVYFLANGDAVVYVGKSKCILGRMSGHCGEKEFSRVFCIPIHECELGWVESAFIAAIRPELNRVGNKSGNYSKTHEHDLKAYFRGEGFIESPRPPVGTTLEGYAERLGISVAKVKAFIKAGELHPIDISSPASGRPIYRLEEQEIARFQDSRRVDRSALNARPSASAHREDVPDYFPE